MNKKIKAVIKLTNEEGYHICQIGTFKYPPARFAVDCLGKGRI